MKIGDYMSAVVTDLKANAKFLRDVGTHGKVLGAEELQRLVLLAPAARIALIGVRGGAMSTTSTLRRDTMGREDSGMFRGPLQMISFLVEQDWKGEEARDRVIKLADNFMYFIEQRQFGLEDAGPAMVTSFDILYAAEIDAQGAAIASVTWEQEIRFGRNLHEEDMALLTGDEYGRYPDDQDFFPERDWTADNSPPPILETEAPPLVRGRLTPQFYGPDIHEDETSPYEHEELTEVDPEGFDEEGRPKE